MLKPVPLNGLESVFMFIQEIMGATLIKTLIYFYTEIRNPKANSLTSNFTLIKIHLFVCLHDLIASKKRILLFLQIFLQVTSPCSVGRESSLIFWRL